ncbi:hypothetical protein ITX31_03335 [Arthrobacter gandavensis]|uniref:DUF6318 family protein n=1 Tax=Arthrobacter gandavensis TaxID=169960 RepID=UPI00188E7CD4|nr:DUF6318 family protein [Arthrobacter gandavensis]MBF4993146.1 hypothetical protein [Arthrobacter gandavensis]
MQKTRIPSGAGRSKRAVVRVLLAGMLTLLLSSCSMVSFKPAVNTSQAEPAETGSSTPAPAEPPAPTPTPSYSQASGAGPAANVELPILPEAARQETKDGLLAFAEYWFELVDYTYQTGDAALLRVVTTPECAVCGGMYGRIPEAYADGGWVEGGLVEMDKLESAFVLTPENRRQATMSVRQKEMIFRDRSGTSVDVVAGNLHSSHMLLEATFTGDGWYVDTAVLTGWPG